MTRPPEVPDIQISVRIPLGGFGGSAGEALGFIAVVLMLCALVILKVTA